MESKDKTIFQIADKLNVALRSVAPLSEPVTVMAPELEIDDAYAIQLSNVRKALASGICITGKKIGLTSLAMQKMFGVNEPDYGHLMEDMEIKDGRVRRADLLQPRVEGEIAFVLKRDIVGPDVTIEQVLAATDYVTSAIEIVDSRIRDWKIKLIDTVSDNASSCRYVLGEEKISPSAVALPEIRMSLYKNGVLVNEGRGADVLGHPAMCVAWLANKLLRYGVTLKAGEVVLSGALSAASAAEKDDVFEARFSAPLGVVQVKFI